MSLAMDQGPRPILSMTSFNLRSAFQARARLLKIWSHGFALFEQTQLCCPHPGSWPVHQPQSRRTWPLYCLLRMFKEFLLQKIFFSYHTDLRQTWSMHDSSPPMLLQTNYRLLFRFDEPGLILTANCGDTALNLIAMRPFRSSRVEASLEDFNKKMIQCFHALSQTPGHFELCACERSL